MFTTQRIGTGMLLSFNPECSCHVKDFADLFECTHRVVRTLPRERAIVFGPVTSTQPGMGEYNLSVLKLQAETLADKGLVVLDIPSFLQYAVPSLIKRLCITGYPHAILDDFTLQLIRSGAFNFIHFRSNYINSLGASIEHNVAEEYSRQTGHRIMYFE